MELDQSVISRLDTPMWDTWNYVGADAEPLCEGDNLAAIEFCIDADRLLMCGKDAAANKMIHTLCKEHGYESVLQFLGKHFRFV